MDAGNLSGDGDGDIDDYPIYLSLSPVPIRFEPVSKVTNVFYDDANQQVFAVRSGGATGVVVKGPKENLNSTFLMEDKGPVVSIKFSPNQQILAVQRSSHSVEFINFTSGTENVQFQEYSQTSKNKNGSIQGFLWTGPNEILFLTKVGLELFQVYPEKRMLKYMKNVSISADWFLCSSDGKMLVVSSGSILQPFALKPGNIYKLPKIDIDIASIPQGSQSPGAGASSRLSERDVSIVSLYGSTAVLILRHKPKASTGTGAEIDVYMLNRENTSTSYTKSHVLKLDTSGRFAINVIDNLIIVHHQASKSSMLFDVRLSNGTDGFCTYHTSIVVGMPIQPYRLHVPSATGEISEIECETYSINWVVFQPNVIIDAKLGCLWFLELKLEPLKSLLPDKNRLVEFYLQRTHGKPYILDLLKNSILTPTSKDFQLVSSVFDTLNENYKSWLNVELQSQMALPAAPSFILGKSTQASEYPTKPKSTLLIDQQDLYTNIFSEFSNTDSCLENPGRITDSYTVFIITEYLRSLTQFQIPVQHFIYELVIMALVRQGAFYQLHQFLMCHVVTDSKPLACLLLSLEGLYPAANQLALDMLKRLSTADDLIVEILLSKQKVIPALRFLQSSGKTDTIPARKFLDGAMKTGDPQVFYGVFRWFEERNLRFRGSFSFEPNELCDVYVEHLFNLFGRRSTCNLGSIGDRDSSS